MGKDKITKDTPQKQLIYAIVKHFGGPSRLGDILYQRAGLELHVQSFVNWYLRGQVPLEKLLVIAKALKVSPYALNFEDYTIMTGKNVSWSEVVEGCSNMLSAELKKELIEWK